jgi:NADH:ubiquinone oxidoreductase subunit 3 (subunit A)
MWLAVVFAGVFVLALGWLFVVARFVGRKRVLQLLRADLERWWSGPGRIKSMRAIYVAPFALFAIQFVWFDSASIWATAALGFAYTATALYALRWWWTRRRPDVQV